ncbi:MAG TPA: hypothetical protein V6C95_23315 [Coleofasciculaceae cyanobacterium]
MSQPELTPKQQALMNYLNQLATTPMTPEKLAEGNRLLDAAADEYAEDYERRQQEIHQQSQGES